MTDGNEGVDSKPTRVVLAEKRDQASKSSDKWPDGVRALPTYVKEKPGARLALLALGIVFFGPFMYGLQFCFGNSLKDWQLQVNLVALALFVGIPVGLALLLPDKRNDHRAEFGALFVFGAIALTYTFGFSCQNACNALRCESDPFYTFAIKAISIILAATGAKLLTARCTEDKGKNTLACWMFVSFFLAAVGGAFFAPESWPIAKQLPRIRCNDIVYAHLLSVSSALAGIGGTCFAALLGATGRVNARRSDRKVFASDNQWAGGLDETLFSNEEDLIIVLKDGHSLLNDEKKKQRLKKRLDEVGRKTTILLFHIHNADADKAASMCRYRAVESMDSEKSIAGNKDGSKQKEDSEKGLNELRKLAKDDDEWFKRNRLITYDCIPTWVGYIGLKQQRIICSLYPSRPYRGNLLTIDNAKSNVANHDEVKQAVDWFTADVEKLIDIFGRDIDKNKTRWRE